MGFKGVYITRTRFPDEYACIFLSRIDPNIRTTVLCTAVKEGGENEWEIVFEAYQSTTATNKKMSLLSAMACSENETLLHRYLLDHLLVIF